LGPAGCEGVSTGSPYARGQGLLIAHGPRKPYAENWPPVIAKICKEKLHLLARLNKKKRIPTWYTVRRWHRRYVANNGDIRALLPGYEKRGRGKQHRSDPEEAFLSEQISKLLVLNGPNTAFIVSAVHSAYDHARMNLPGAGNWTKPSRATIYRRINDIDAHELARRREGSRIANQRYQLVGAGAKASYRLELVEIDHTVGNVHIYDDRTRTSLGRPTITIAIDRYTRMVVGLYIGFEPPSTYSVMQCLYNMIMPKDYLITELGIREIDWPAFGIPVGVVVDNAIEFIQDSFKACCAQLNMDIWQAPVKRPDFKAKVERFIRNLSEGAVTYIPGKTPQSPKKSSQLEHRPEDLAVVTLAKFRTEMHRWLLTKYCNEIHSGIMDVPARRWLEEVEALPVRLPKSVYDLRSVLGIYREGTITREGIRFSNLHYQSRRLNELLRAGHKTLKFTVDAGNLGSITGVDPTTHEPFDIPCTYYQYAKDLPLHTHRRVWAMLRKRNEAFRNQAHLVAARIEFHKRAEELLMSRRSRNRKAIARDAGGSNVKQPRTELNRDIDSLILEPTSDQDFAAVIAEEMSTSLPFQSNDSDADSAEDRDSDAAWSGYGDAGADDEITPYAAPSHAAEDGPLGAAGDPAPDETESPDGEPEDPQDDIDPFPTFKP
jgi:putative transposase